MSLAKWALELGGADFQFFVSRYSYNYVVSYIKLKPEHLDKGVQNDR
jgi:hypothetical protein